MEVQRPRLVHLLQLLPVPKVQGEVSGDDGFADDLQHLLILAGAQSGEDVVPFQLQRDQRKATISSTPSLKASSATWKQYGWITASNVTAMTTLGKQRDCFVVVIEQLLMWMILCVGYHLVPQNTADFTMPDFCVFL